MKNNRGENDFVYTCITICVKGYVKCLYKPSTEGLGGSLYSSSESS